MKSWSRPALNPVASPAGADIDVRLFDTAAGEIVPIDLGEQAGLYVCGITP